MAMKRLKALFTRKERRWIKHTAHHLARLSQQMTDPNNKPPKNWLESIIITAIESLAARMEAEQSAIDFDGHLVVKGGRTFSLFVQPGATVRMITEAAAVDDSGDTDLYCLSTDPASGEVFLERPTRDPDSDETERLWSSDQVITQQPPLTGYELIMLANAYAAGNPKHIVLNASSANADRAIDGLIRKGFLMANDGPLKEYAITEAGERRIAYALNEKTVVMSTFPLDQGSDMRPEWLKRRAEEENGKCVTAGHDPFVAPMSAPLRDSQAVD